jgi:hypothetical protein
MQGRTLPQGLDGRTGVRVDECAAAARDRGFPLFALQGKGQCFFGSVADVARIPASQKLADAACNDLPCPASAAICPATTNKVYFLIGTHILYLTNNRLANVWTLLPVPLHIWDLCAGIGSPCWGLAQNFHPKPGKNPDIACQCSVCPPLISGAWQCQSCSSGPQLGNTIFGEGEGCLNSTLYTGVLTTRTREVYQRLWAIC